MTCQPKAPTGEKLGTRFRAPRLIPGLPAEAQRALQQALRDIEADLRDKEARLDPPEQTQPLAVAGTVQAREGQVIRVTPPAAGITVLLPTARASNKGEDISILVEGDDGPVTVRAVLSTVQDVAAVTLEGEGLRVLRSDGDGGWWIVGQSSESPDAGAGHGYIVATSTPQLPHARVATTSPTISLGYATPGLVRWDWLGLQASAGTSSAQLTQLVLADSNGLSFGLNGSTITGSHNGVRSFRLSAFGNDSTFASMTATSISGTLIHLASHPFASYVSTENVYFRISSGSIGAYAFQNIQGQLAARASLLNSNGVSFGSLTQDDLGIGRIVFVTASVASSLTAINVSAGTTSNNLSNVVLSNANNVSFGLNGSTVTATATVASTADPQIGLVSHVGGNSVTSVTRLAFSNASNVTWSLSTAANAATVLASVAAGGGGGLTAINVSAGTTSNNLSNVVLSNANNVSFGLNGSTITATATVASSQGSIRFTAGTTNSLVSNISFANSNGLSFGLNGSTITASNNITNFRISAGTEAALGSQISFADSHNIAFGLNVSTITARASAIALAIPGSTYTTGTVSFSNDTNVSGILSATSNFGRTNVGFFTSTNSAVVAVAGFQVAANGLGGRFVSKIEFQDSNCIRFGEQSSTDTGGRMAAITASVLTAPATFVSADAALESHNNVAFTNSGGSLAATAVIGFRAGTNSTGTDNAVRVTKLQYLDSNGVTFGLQTNNDANGGRQAILTASVAAGGGAQTAVYYRNFANISSSQVVALAGRSNSMMLFPLGFAPFPGNMTVSNLDLVLSANVGTTSNSSHGITIRGGVYTLANSTQLSLVNSFSFSSSRQSSATSALATSLNGIRWMVLSSSNWSSSPVFSLGANYWMLCGFRFGGNGSGIFAQWAGCSGNNMNVGANFAGTFGVAGTAAISSRWAPFVGSINTTAPPTTIGTAALLCDAAMSVWHPFVQLRAALFQ